MKKIPDSELEIMMIIWDAHEAVTSDYVMERIGRDWAKPTVLNFLSRLCERGYLGCEKCGRYNVYRPEIGLDEYRKNALGDFMARLFHNSPKSLIASLWDGGAITAEERSELRSFIEQLSEGGSDDN